MSGYWEQHWAQIMRDTTFKREILQKYMQERQKTIHQDDTNHKQVVIPVNLAVSECTRSSLGSNT